MKWRGFLGLAFMACVTASAQQGPAGELQRLARFIVSHYGSETRLANREIDFSAPLIGEPVVFRHFLWTVVARDQYGRKLQDELSGIVKYGESGDLQQLVVSGPLTGDERLKRLRTVLDRTGKWPKRVGDMKFGPASTPDAVSIVVADAVKELLGHEVTVQSATFHLRNRAGRADGTWQVLLSQRDGLPGAITVRVEPFSGKIVQIDVSGSED